MNSYKELIRKNKGVFSNTIFLSIIEIIRIGLPFITLPYVIKTIGTEKYGEVVFAQSVISYFIIIINYGLNISAVKDISVNRENSVKLNEILSSVLLIKLILLLLMIVILIFSLAYLPILKENKILFIYAFLACIAEVLFPIWYYIGIEKMKYLTLIQVSSILFYNIFIFIIVKTDKDYPYVALLYSLSNILSALISFYILFIKDKRRFVLPPLEGILRYFYESTPFFISRISDVFNSNIAKILSGIFFNMHLVAAFELAQKMASVAVIPISMLNRSLYPNIAKNLNRETAMNFFYIVLGVSFCVSLSVFFISPFIIQYFSGNQLNESVIILRILCLFTFCAGLSTYVGTPILVAFGYPKPFNLSVLLSSLVMLFFYCCLYLFNIVTIYNFAIALVLAELFVFLYRLYYSKKYKILFSKN